MAAFASRLHPRHNDYKGGLRDPETGVLTDRLGFAVPETRTAPYLRHCAELEETLRLTIPEWQTLRPDTILTSESPITDLTITPIERDLAARPLMTEALRRLVAVAVPDTLRGRLWLMAAGGTAVWRGDPRQFEDCLSKQSQKKSPATAQIEKDIGRTLSDHPLFTSEDGRESLKRVLIGAF
eukprot:TRINITY_DN3749_c0_g1_i4.p1 TRINITY_DN3749_c0_g1~~TRINITY_DN3749_c0_g1_i4.p1  ORF type:complete len:182 (+),score=8.06 TRINITY_DN3749_c0_g1_i4:169-714(+)